MFLDSFPNVPRFFSNLHDCKFTHYKSSLKIVAYKCFVSLSGIGIKPTYGVLGHSLTGDYRIIHKHVIVISFFVNAKLQSSRSKKLPSRPTALDFKEPKDFW